MYDTLSPTNQLTNLAKLYMKKVNFYWIYILECKNDSYYTGYTENLGKRYYQHVTGTGSAKFTRSFKPDHIAQAWRLFGSKGDALRIEKMIKDQDRKTKVFLVKYPERLKEMADREFDSDFELYTFNPHLVEWEALNLSKKDIRKNKNPYSDAPPGHIT